MTITSKSSSGQNTTTSGKYVQAFIQKRCGTKWVPIGCSNISDLTFDPRTMSYNICIGPDGRRRQTKITREDDPRPITMVYDLTNSINRGKALGLHRRQLDGCTHNMLIKLSDCPQVDSAALDPANFTDAIILYALSETGGFQFGNNTLRSRDDRQADDLLGQTTYVFEGYAYLNKYTPSTQSLAGSVSINITQLIAHGEGACADGVCSDCDREACQNITWADTDKFMSSTNDGASYITFTAPNPTSLNKFDGKIIAGHGTSVSISTDNGQTWVSGVLPLNTELLDATRVDANLYVGVARVNTGGGPQYNTVASTDGGYQWQTIGTLGTNHMQAISWDGVRLTAAGSDAAGNVVIMTSSNYGKTWSVAGSPGIAGPDGTFNVYYSGADTFIMGGFNLYKNQCDANGTQAIAQVNGPFSGTLTGIGGCPDNCNEIWATTSNGQVFHSIDGGATWNQLKMPGITVTADPVRNAIACCGSKVYTAFTDTLVVWRAAGANGASLDPFSA